MGFGSARAILTAFLILTFLVTACQKAQVATSVQPERTGASGSNSDTTSGGTATVNGGLISGNVRGEVDPSNAGVSLSVPPFDGALPSDQSSVGSDPASDPSPPLQAFEPFVSPLDAMNSLPTASGDSAAIDFSLDLNRMVLSDVDWIYGGKQSFASLISERVVDISGNGEIQAENTTRWPGQTIMGVLGQAGLGNLFIVMNGAGKDPAAPGVGRWYVLDRKSGRYWSIHNAVPNSKWDEHMAFREVGNVLQVFYVDGEIGYYGASELHVYEFDLLARRPIQTRRLAVAPAGRQFNTWPFYSSSISISGRIPAGNLIWGLLGDGSNGAVRINVETGVIEPINLPPLAGASTTNGISFQTSLSSSRWLLVTQNRPIFANQTPWNGFYLALYDSQEARSNLLPDELTPAYLASLAGGSNSQLFVVPNDSSRYVTLQVTLPSGGGSSATYTTAPVLLVIDTQTRALRQIQVADADGSAGRRSAGNMFFVSFSSQKAIYRSVSGKIRIASIAGAGVAP